MSRFITHFAYTEFLLIRRMYYNYLVVLILSFSLCMCPNYLKCFSFFYPGSIFDCSQVPKVHEDLCGFSVGTGPLHTQSSNKLYGAYLDMFTRPICCLMNPIMQILPFTTTGVWWVKTFCCLPASPAQPWPLIEGKMISFYLMRLKSKPVFWARYIIVTVNDWL